MKIFIGIGTTEMQMVPTELLAESLRKYAGEAELVIKSICEEEEYKDIKDLANLSVGTVFSLQRFLVAKIGARYNCDYAMHIDSDIICLNLFGDMIKLFAGSDKMLCIAAANDKFNQPVQSAVLLTRTDKKTCDFFADRLADYVNNHRSYSKLLNDLCNDDVSVKAEYIYNSRDFAESKTVFLHYTDLWTQPWVTPFRKEAAVWMEKHFEKMSADSKYREAVIDGVKKKYYRAGIIESGFFCKIKDLFFLAPQIKVYAGRYHLGWLPDPILGFAAQVISFIRSALNIRTT